MSSNVEKHLKTMLCANDSLYGLVANRVYPIFSPSNVDLPYITYQRQSTSFINSQADFTGTGVASITVSSWASTYLGSKELADAVREAVRGWSDTGLVPKIDMAMLVDESDAFINPQDGNEFPEAYGVIHQVEVTFEER